MAELVVRWTSVGDGIAQHAVTLPVVVNAVSAEEAAAAAPDPEVREQVLVLQAARARDEAIRLADAGEHGRAKQLLSERQAELRAAGLVTEADALREAEELVEPIRYDAVSRKRLHYRSQQARRGRP